LTDLAKNLAGTPSASDSGLFVARDVNQYCRLRLDCFLQCFSRDALIFDAVSERFDLSGAVGLRFLTEPLRRPPFSWAF
jgi:hypothetical protein